MFGYVRCNSRISPLKRHMKAPRPFIIRKTKNQDFKNEKSKKTANDLLIAFID